MEWLGWLMMIALVAAFFATIDYLVRTAQRGGPAYRNHDNSSPGGYYSDLG
jgi:hypothetical protein